MFAACEEGSAHGKPTIGGFACVVQGLSLLRRSAGQIGAIFDNSTVFRIVTRHYDRQ
jgi:hypothetical protein